MNIPIEYFGTAASVVVALSLTQKNIKKLRILNLIGAAAFAVYGFFIDAWPVLGLNAFISIIDIYYLVEMKRRNNYFELLKIESPATSIYLQRFIEFYHDDIMDFMPSFKTEDLLSSEAVFVLRDLLPVSLIIYRPKDDGFSILVDYAIDAYRDLKNASFFFEKIADTFEMDEAVFYAKPGSLLHNKYLRRIGFVFSDKNDSFVYKKSRQGGNR